jgi:hypothetical protein
VTAAGRTAKAGKIEAPVVKGRFFFAGQSRIAPPVSHGYSDTLVIWKIRMKNKIFQGAGRAYPGKPLQIID